ncbi:MAG TPA: DUF3417 domain-containing protein [Dongiaceae bacterium]|nr:DUF3417 domain-containing protein [Dongiaceae bacterium]
MNKQTPVSHPICNLLPKDVEGFDSLVELALDMRWSWNHATDEVWRQLDPVLWPGRSRSGGSAVLLKILIYSGSDESYTTFSLICSVIYGSNVKHDGFR